MTKITLLLLPVAISLGAWTTIVAADEVPRLDVARTCRAEAAGQDRTAVDACMKDEQQARDQLTREWDRFAAQNRTNCTREATGIAGIQSYVELLTCLQIARDVQNLRKE